MKSIIRFSILMFVLSLSLVSCLKEDDDSEKKAAEETKLKNYLAANKIDAASKVNGIYFLLKDSGNGTKPVGTDYVLVNYNLRLLDRTLIETNNKKLASSTSDIVISVNTSGPLYGKLNSLGLSGIVEGLKMMKEGDSALFVIPNDMALGSYYTSSVPSYSNLLYEVRLVKIINDPIAYDRDLINKVIVDSMQITAKDSDANGNYIKVLNLGDTTKSITSGDNVKVKYKGSFIDGRYFGDVNKFDTLLMVTGSNRYIKGFETTVLSLHKGAKAKVVIPYYNGYGANGRYESNGSWSVPVYTSLYYEIEVLDFY